MVDLFHSHVDPQSLEAVPKEFVKENSRIRCLISTIAFGMGVQVPLLTYVIHWGPPSSVLDYWQEVGRCARGGGSGKAFLYTPAYSRNPRMVEKPMLDIVSSSTKQCIRKAVLKQLKLEAISDSEIDKCCYHDRCCSFCDAKAKDASAE